MTSSNPKISKRRLTYIRFLSEIKHALNQALVEEFRARKLTQKKMADLLGVNRSFISRKLSGDDNMTLETLADLAFALDRPIKIAFTSRHQSVNEKLPEIKTYASAEHQNPFSQFNIVPIFSAKKITTMKVTEFPLKRDAA